MILSEKMISREVIEKTYYALREIGCTREEQFNKLSSYKDNFEKAMSFQAIIDLKNIIDFLKRAILLEDALQKAWSKETCYPTQACEWTLERPSFGQSDVTALVVQKYLGGEILECPCRRHFWNKLLNDKDFDFVLKETPKKSYFRMGRITTREDVLEGESAVANETTARYTLLLARVENILHEQK
ncbi:MAG: hypothetical protein HQ536_00730 [Parcubacteria group bacterium]|nr:hypothetical protein [Parcubacteria group bacterium]